MNDKVLIVEDELLIALDIEDTVASMGLAVAGIARNKEKALAVAPMADIALVDVNLADGPTGPAIGRILAQDYGVTVIFMTANPEAVAAGVQGVLGVVTKPVAPRTVQQSIRYAIARRIGQLAAVPSGLQAFA